MAKYRTIRTSFWADPYIENLCSDEKLLYMYLFSSPCTNNLGILEITRRKISFESGLSLDVVNRGIARFESDGKTVTDENIIWLSNFIKNQTSTSWKLVKGLRELLAETGSEKIRGAILKRYPDLFCDADTVSDGMDTVSDGMDTVSDGMDTVYIPSGEMEREREREREQKDKRSCSELSGDSSKQVTPDVVIDAVITLPLNTGGEFPISQTDVDEWTALYPAVDVVQQLRNMRGWLLSNPTRRKTQRGVRRFVTGWLTKEQDRGGSVRASPAISPVQSWQERESEKNMRDFLET